MCGGLPRETAELKILSYLDINTFHEEFNVCIGFVADGVQEMQFLVCCHISVVGGGREQRDWKGKSKDQRSQR